MTALLPYCQFIPKRLHDLTFPAGVPQFHCIGLDEVHKMKINKGYTGTIVMLSNTIQFHVSMVTNPMTELFSQICKRHTKEAYHY